jgi:hypothetical protein
VIILKKLLGVAFGILTLFLFVTPIFAKGGFNEFGYNYQARIFNGTGWSWCMSKVGDEAWCEAYLGDYRDDKIVMKWNAEWDRGNAEGWNNPPYDAWENNEWNGMKDGSGAVWHYKIVWVGNCVADPGLVPEGGYCIWGQFATIMDHGIDPSYGPGHFWFAHANPTGYGVYPLP